MKSANPDVLDRASFAITVVLLAVIAHDGSVSTAALAAVIAILAGFKLGQPGHLPRYLVAASVAILVLWSLGG